MPRKWTSAWAVVGVAAVVVLVAPSPALASWIYPGFKIEPWVTFPYNLIPGHPYFSYGGSHGLVMNLIEEDWPVIRYYERIPPNRQGQREGKETACFDEVSRVAWAPGGPFGFSAYYTSVDPSQGVAKVWRCEYPRQTTEFSSIAGPYGWIWDVAVSNDPVLGDYIFLAATYKQGQPPGTDILRVDPSGNMQVFLAGLSHIDPYNAPGIRIHLNVAFGKLVLIIDHCDFDDLRREVNLVDSSGTMSPFTDFGFSLYPAYYGFCSGVRGDAVTRGGAFGESLYLLTDWDMHGGGTISRFDSQGNSEIFAVTDENLLSFRESPGGGFGEAIYMNVGPYLYTFDPPPPSPLFSIQRIWPDDGRCGAVPSETGAIGGGCVGLAGAVAGALVARGARRRSPGEGRRHVQRERS